MQSPELKRHIHDARRRELRSSATGGLKALPGLISKALEDIQHGLMFVVMLGFVVAGGAFVGSLVVTLPWVVLRLVGVASGTYPPSWLLGTAAGAVALMFLGQLWQRMKVDPTA